MHSIEEKIKNGTYGFKIGTHHAYSGNVEELQYYALNVEFDLPSDLGLSVCQNITIEEQFRLGVRLFDVRIAKFNDEYFVTHYIIFSDLKTVVKDFEKLVEDNPEE